MGDLGWVTQVVARLGPQTEDVWLLALGVGCVAPLAAMAVPRVSRVLGVCAATAAFASALVATVQQQTVLALGLITLALACGFVSSWSAGVVREAVGPISAGSPPRHRPGNVALTRAQSRSFDYLVMR